VDEETSVTTFEFTNSGATCEFVYAITSDVEWLSFDPSEGQVDPNQTTLITVTATLAGLGLGDHNAMVTIDHNDVDSPEEIPLLLAVTEEADDPASLPTEFAFYQNYPNPFNATTTLRFDLPAETRVDIVIFNLMGQEVARPANATYPAGRHKIMYTADALPSGMYIVQLNAGSFKGLNKMVLLK
jgi:hypothetical protein